MEIATSLGSDVRALLFWEQARWLSPLYLPYISPISPSPNLTISPLYPPALALTLTQFFVLYFASPAAPALLPPARRDALSAHFGRIAREYERKVTVRVGVRDRVRIIVRVRVRVRVRVSPSPNPNPNQLVFKP